MSGSSRARTSRTEHLREEAFLEGMFRASRRLHACMTSSDSDLFAVAPYVMRFRQ
jgi:hypothetical protein